ncbi:MAG TPA: HEAT repeat domain-containing protein [Terriglobales bacterium]
MATLPGRVAAISPRFESSQWSIRKSAFDELAELGAGGADKAAVAPILDLMERAPGQAEAIRADLVHLLERENQFVQSAGTQGSTLPEDYLEYYGNLIAAVGALKDVQAIPALLSAITTGGNATRGLAELGEPALEPVLQQTNNPNPSVRSSALFTIRDMLNMKKLADPKSLARVDEVLRKSLEDTDPSVRTSAIWAIGATGDKQFLPALSRIADCDPATLPGEADGGGTFYPVRHAARTVAKTLQGGTADTH